MKKHDYGSTSHWNKVLKEEFEKESDRAAVILTASLFDNSLAQMITVSLVASPSSTDDLLDGANAPLSIAANGVSIAIVFE